VRTDPLHLKLLGFVPIVGSEQFSLPYNWFAAVFDDFTSRCLYAPEVKSLELFIPDTQEYVIFYRIFGGIKAKMTSPHVYLSSGIKVHPGSVEIIEKCRPVMINRLDMFPVPEWK